MAKQLLVHVDLDSPTALLPFYGLDGDAISQNDLNRFYDRCFERMLAFFKEQGIVASLFVVGKDIERSASCREQLRKAHRDGHELENHTHSHPFGLADLPATRVVDEIETCNRLIEDLVGSKPQGFRSPGYSMNNALMAQLETMGFTYESSGFWSVMQPLMGLTQKLFFKGSKLGSGFGDVTRSLPQTPYHPSTEQWTVDGSRNGRSLLELPLPRTPHFGLPFYHNFNLWSPHFLATASAASVKHDPLVYLFHLIEFADPADRLPEGILRHPNATKPYSVKLARTRAIFKRLNAHYTSVSTRTLVKEWAHPSK